MADAVHNDSMAFCNAPLNSVLFWMLSIKYKIIPVFSALLYMYINPFFFFFNQSLLNVFFGFFLDLKNKFLLGMVQVAALKISWLMYAMTVYIDWFKIIIKQWDVFVYFFDFGERN